MINSIFTISLLFIIPFLEMFFFSLLQISIFLVFWELYFKKNDNLITQLILVLISIILDVALKNYLGTHLLAIFVFEGLNTLLSKIFGEEESIIGIVIKAISISMYYIFLLLLSTLNFGSFLNLNNLGKIIISSLITLIITEIFKGKYQLKKVLK